MDCRLSKRLRLMGMVDKHIIPKGICSNNSSVDSGGSGELAVHQECLLKAPQEIPVLRTGPLQKPSKDALSPNTPSKQSGPTLC